MSMFDEMTNTTAGALEVVDDDGIGVEKRWRPVDEHDRRTGAALVEQVAVVGTRRHDHERVHAPVGEGGDERALLGRVVVAAAGEHEHVTVASDVLDGTLHCGRERVGKVFEDHADRRRAPVGTTQRTGGEVVAVVEPIDGAHHPGGHLDGNAGLAVDDPRDGLDADPGQCGDVTHRRARARWDGSLIASLAFRQRCHRCRRRTVVDIAVWPSQKNILSRPLGLALY